MITCSSESAASKQSRSHEGQQREGLPNVDCKKVACFSHFILTHTSVYHYKEDPGDTSRLMLGREVCIRDDT